jgi:radical SAM superfamily enzyme YgiQ (UPF0313 family)
VHVLLITPENAFIKAFRRRQLNNFVQLTMPYLAGFVSPPHTVALVDEYNQRVDLDARADLVGITCNTSNATHVYAMADAFRERGRRVVLGGPHATLLPDEAASHADSVVIGEAETTWPQVLADAAADRLAPRYASSEAPSLSGVPHARRDLIHRRGLLRNTIVATRGCPHRCSYCNLRQIYDTKIRFRPVDEVVAEVRTFRSPFFTFWDDQLFMNPRYALRLFEGLRSQRKRWAAMVTLASTRNERLLKAAANSGCVCLFLGLESFTPASLRLANKAFNVVETYNEGIARIHSFGISVQAGIVFGFDGDDETTFEATLRGATRAGIDGATVSILTPFPRTPVYEELASSGRLLTRDWSYFNGKTAVTFRPAKMSAETLWDGYMWFRRRFFSRSCVLERARRSKVRRLQSMALGWGYARAVDNEIPGWPIPPAGREGAMLEWCGERRRRGPRLSPTCQPAPRP